MGLGFITNSILLNIMGVLVGLWMPRAGAGTKSSKGVASQAPLPKPLFKVTHGLRLFGCSCSQSRIPDSQHEAFRPRREVCRVTASWRAKEMLLETRPFPVAAGACREGPLHDVEQVLLERSACQPAPKDLDIGVKRETGQCWGLPVWLGAEVVVVLPCFRGVGVANQGLSSGRFPALRELHDNRRRGHEGRS